MEDSAQVVARRFREKYGRAPDVIASAPGRVNLIGEHTDYNDGVVLPMAIDRRTYAACANGCEPVVETEIPMGAGLSSSAAFDVSVLRAQCQLDGSPWDPIRAARLAQQTEQGRSGVQCGIMDQLASAASRAGHAMLLDCRSLEWQTVPWPESLTIVVMDTGSRRELSQSAYNERRGECEAAVAVLREHDRSIRALRDVSPTLLDSVAPTLEPTLLKRARHVVEECARPARMADALRNNDPELAGALMNASHASLRDLYEVSSAQLDLACDAARSHPACHGARMTGAGFGGCAIALVDNNAVKDFIRWAKPRYEAASYLKSDFFAVQPSEGARLETV